MNKELFEKGLAIRKSVIGAEFVDKALASADDFNMPLQELVTEYCWGAVWGREGLTKKTRSLLNIAMLSVLNRPHELKVHTKGAIKNGATKEEIREVLMQVAIYAGVPAGVDSFRAAKEVFAQLDQQIRNRLLRQDLARGRVGLGFLTNLAQAHGRLFLEMLERDKKP